MSDYSDLSAGIRVVTQLPTVAKAYFLDEASMVNLGADDNLAYSYEEGLPVYCAAEEKTYRWREVIDGEIGKMEFNFIYPSNHYCGGINYSNRVFNFFEVKYLRAPIPYLGLEIKSFGPANVNKNPYKLFVGDIVEGRKTAYTYWDSAMYIGNDPDDRENCYVPLVETIIDVDNPDFPFPGSNIGPPGKSAYEVAVEQGFVGTVDEWLLSLKGTNGQDGLDGESAYQIALNNGFNGTQVQWIESLKGINGTNGTNGISAYQVALNTGFVGSEAQWIASLKGANGQNASNNLQDTIDTGRALTNSDNNYVLYINNGSVATTMTVPASGLMSKFNCGFYFMGTGTVSFVGASGVTILNPVGFKGYGQGYSCYIERIGNTQTYSLDGDTKP